MFEGSGVRSVLRSQTVLYDILDSLYLPLFRFGSKEVFFVFLEFSIVSLYLLLDFPYC